MRYLLLSDFASRQLPITRHETYKYKLLCYAARSWPSHFLAVDNDTRARYLPEARQLCSTSQPPLRTWGGYYVWNFSGGGPIFPNFYGWSDLAVVSFVGLQVLVEDLVENVGVDVNELCDDYGTALHAAVAGRQESIAAYLISKKADVDRKPFTKIGTPLDIAVSLRRHRGIVQLLLKHGASPLNPCWHGAFIRWKFYSEARGNSPTHVNPLSILACAAMLPEKDIFYTMLSSLVDTSTPEGIMDAATDKRIIESGDECVAMLLHCLPDEWLADERVLTTNSLKSLISIPSVGERVIRVIKEHNQQHLLLKKASLEVGAWTNGMKDLICDFISQIERPSKYITQEILETIALHYDPATLRLFIQSSPQEICTTKDLVIPALKNELHYRIMPFVVLESASAAIMADEELQRRLLNAHYPWIGQTATCVEVFLQLPKPVLFVKKLLIIAALKCGGLDRGERDIKMIRQVLEHCNDVQAVDNDILECAAVNSRAAVVQLLLEYNPALSMAEERYLAAAAGSFDTGREVMEFLLRTYGSEAVITPHVVKNAAGCNNGVFEMLLEDRPEQVAITVDVVHRFSSQDMFQAILRHRYEDMKQIASELLHTVTDPFQPHRDAMETMLNCCPLAWFKPTETLMLNVLERDGWETKAQMSLLIKTFGDKIPVTERILASAVASNKGGEIPDIFRNWKPDQFKVTPWIVEKVAAGGNPQGLDYLVRASGGQLVIDDKWYALSRFRYYVSQYRLTDCRKAWAEVSGGDIADAHGKTALHVAADGLNVPLALVRFLLNETKAVVHATDRRGWTALHFAVQQRKLDVVTMLLATGADPHQAGLDGHTPISLVESDFIDYRYMDRDTLLLVLRDEWCVGFLDPMFGRDDSDEEEDGNDGELGG